MIDNLKNPKIKVVWEDTAESFNQEKIARIKTYFAKKYKTKNVTVVTKTIIDKKDIKLSSMDMADNILDPAYQKELMQDFIKEQSIDVEWDLISRLDDRVNNEIDQNKQNTIRFRQWYIKRLEFSNFLSYGDNNIVEFDKLGGVTCIESDPPNFGGKTVMAVDLLMFLFFNKTTKTKKNEEIFNRFTTKDEVHVRGDVVIDGDEYVIVRNLKRKEKRAGGYSVSSSLEFIRKMPDGTMLNLSGEQRRETEEFIKSAIGTEDDFLTTILTTGGNLEDLIDAKPTALGQVFTKFIGLETLKEKEEVAKKIYSDWSKSLISNVYNTEELKNVIESSKDLINVSKTKVDELINEGKTKDSELKVMQTEKDSLLRRRHSDVDEELEKMNPELFKKDVKELQDKVSVAQHYYDEIEVVEPKEYYVSEDHDIVRDELSELKVQSTLIENEKNSITNLVEQLKNGEICPTCNRALDDVDHTDEISKKENELKDIIVREQSNSKLLSEKIELESKFTELKNAFEAYDRDKLRKEKSGVELMTLQLELREKEDKLKQWESNKTKLTENLLIEKDIVSLTTKITSYGEQIERIRHDIQELRSDIKTAEAKVEDAKDKIAKIKKEGEVAKIFEIFLSIIGKNGVSKYILRSMVPVINSELQRLLEDSCRFTLEIRLSEKNEIEFIMVDDETRVEKAMSSGSGYERTIAAMALRAVLSKVSALPKPNVIVMDEVFGKVADDNLDMVGEFFRKIKSYFEHIFVITHNPLVKNWSDHVITINKDANVSKIKNIK